MPAVPLPRGYSWLLEKGLAGTKAFSALQPWYLLDVDGQFDAKSAWPAGPVAGRMFAFARRQDTDDIACFAPTADAPERVVVIHGWTGDGAGYSLDDEYPDLWGWLKAAIDDVRDWADQADLRILATSVTFHATRDGA